VNDQVTGHIFWYSSETPDQFAKELFTILLDIRHASFIVTDQQGVTKSKSLSSSSAGHDVWPPHVNLIVGKGKIESSIGSGKVALRYQPSPLSRQYDPFVGKREYPLGSNHEQISQYRSLASYASYAKLRQIVEYPNFMQFTIEAAVGAAALYALQVGENVSSLRSQGQLRWLGVLDVPPESRLAIAGDLLLGNQEPLTDRLDRYMLAPSFITMGSKETISSYRDDLANAFPDEVFTFREIGDSAFLALSDVGAVKRIFLPHWHQSRR
jgi:hypothetical protein